MKNFILCLFYLTNLSFCVLKAQDIPLPEHPRPDFERTEWENLNGSWKFGFDSLDTGIKDQWFSNTKHFPLTIKVPFPWGSPLSGVPDKADIGWYQKNITVKPDWKDKRIFITVGASDWESSIWIDNQLVGTHQGGYTPFSFELTKYIQPGKEHSITIRVDDKRRLFTLYGKQGYGNARGIWQTIYLDARGKDYIDAFKFIPDIDVNKVKVEVDLSEVSTVERKVNVDIQTPNGAINGVLSVKPGFAKGTLDINIPNPRLWDLEDPYLYMVNLSHAGDKVNTYFGMRKISVTNLPGTNYPYISLNNKPVYLQLTLDQSYHPDGFYTFPTDEFMKNEIQMTKDLGLNGLRTHIKIDVPRKLYWADKLGLLVMADLPNSWGEPDAAMQKESEYTLRKMIERDFNHPAIFSWIVFNESWGLQTKVLQNETNKTRSVYLPTTQNWVASMYYLAKSLDPTRLVEDNSICCGAGHTETDINSWHEYMAGWEWEARLASIDKETYPGSGHHFEKGFSQLSQPNINSECGNVWGYEGSTGDVDWSWDYHRMINTFRKYPKVAGWLYTEHHDVINEWNGYWRFDRSPKYSGLSDLAKGMTDKDFHSPIYLSSGNDISATVKPGETIKIPLFISDMAGKSIKDDHLILETIIYGMDNAGHEIVLEKRNRKIAHFPFINSSLSPEIIKAMSHGGLMRVHWTLKDVDGKIHHHNFFSIIIPSDVNPEKLVIHSVQPSDYLNAEWSVKKWHILDSLKVNGTGKGFFEYQIPIKGLKLTNVNKASFLVELSSKPLLDKDKDKVVMGDQNYMLGARVSPHLNPNAYPMTDNYKNPSNIEIYIDGVKTLSKKLEDDPADHRGVLSWHNQLKDKKLREAGTYGEKIEVPLSKSMLKKALQKGYINIKISADQGVAVYGSQFGRYPINPSICTWYN
jgi:hypothetical protein